MTSAPASAMTIGYSAGRPNAEGERPSPASPLQFFEPEAQLPKASSKAARISGVLLALKPQ